MASVVPLYILLACLVAAPYCGASTVDVRHAFACVTNNTEDSLERLIDSMYRDQDAAEDFQFKLTAGEGSPDQFAMLSLKRSDFEEPTFPNLTAENRFLMLMQKQRYAMKLAHNKEWSDIGLDGWTGELAEPNESNEQDINPLAVEAATEGNHAEDDLSVEEQEENIFIARANDPYGLSTMWPRKQPNSQADRSKRDVVKLYSMIKCSTGCDPLAYKGYGCFCGFLGAGLPVNGIDRCCRSHDQCYEQSNCISYLEYFVPYLWKCYRGKPVCAYHHGEWGGPGSCAARLCNCDLQLSRCLRKFACPRQKAACHSSPARQLRNLFFRK